MTITCQAHNCSEEADGALMVRFTQREPFRPHNGNGRYCQRHLIFYKPAMEGESAILPAWPIIVRTN